MKILKNYVASMPLLALMLAGCVGIIIPAPQRVDNAPFISLLQQAPCANGDNRLFVIDNRYVYWDRGASCQDQVQRLYGATTEALLCVHGDAPGGAYTDCRAPSVRGMFQIIINNRHKADLGLGAGHSVMEVRMQPPDPVNLAFRTVAMEAFSGIHSPRNVVLRDAAAWATVWAEHTAGRFPPPPLPPVDFSQQMLVAIFAGDLRGCHEFEIRRINAVNERIVVEYEDRDISATTICISAITNPMQVAAIARSDATVVFDQIVPQRLDFATIERTPYSRIEVPVNVVVRDAQSWARLWARHAGPGAPVPAVDFSTSMVAAVFRGLLPNGCYSTEITDVYRVRNVINVERIDTEPGPLSVCTLAAVTPAHLVTMPREERRVTFSRERLVLP